VAIKLYIQTKKEKLGGTGKHKFLQRMIPYLEDLGVKCQFSSKGADVTLGIGHYRDKTKVPAILRLDGIHLDSIKKYNYRNYWANCQIRGSIWKSNAVIFQTEFCRRIIKGMITDKIKKEYVIYNGANPKDYEVEPMESEYPNNVILSARWKSGKLRRSKRLKPMLEIASQYCKMRNDVCFWVAGDTDIDLGHSRIKMLGYVKEPELRRYLKMADVMLYLAWAEWCPNAVVECLIAGTPVICANGNGVEEIVKGCGTICVFDKPMEAKAVKKIKPPTVDEKMVFAALDCRLKDKKRVEPHWLHVEEIAKQYYQVIKDVLK